MQKTEVSQGHIAGENRSQSRTYCCRNRGQSRAYYFREQRSVKDILLQEQRSVKGILRQLTEVSQGHTAPDNRGQSRAYCCMRTEVSQGHTVNMKNMSDVLLLMSNVFI